MSPMQSLRCYGNVYFRVHCHSNWYLAFNQATNKALVLVLVQVPCATHHPGAGHSTESTIMTGKRSSYVRACVCVCAAKYKRRSLNTVKPNHINQIADGLIMQVVAAGCNSRLAVHDRSRTLQGMMQQYATATAVTATSGNNNQPNGPTFNRRYLGVVARGGDVGVAGGGADHHGVDGTGPLEHATLGELALLGSGDDAFLAHRPVRELLLVHVHVRRL